MPMPRSPISPTELRQIFGSNLRKLAQASPSISALCRDLGINRTQFNRYLAGESFPRPDVLHRICSFFDVDARILLEPVDDTIGRRADAISHPELRSFIAGTSAVITEEVFPSGFYSFSRVSFLDPDKYIRGLVYIYRKDRHAFLKGFEAREAVRQLGMRVCRETREFRGVLMPQEGGIAALVSRRNAITTSFNFLAPIPSFENNYWVGYTARTVRENPPSQRVVRLVYEYLGRDRNRVMSAARATGYCTVDDLPAYHRTQLKPGQTFE